MFLDELRALPEVLVAPLDPVRVQEYVRASGWAHNPSANGKSAVYERPESGREQIIIPLSRELRDFAPRMAEAIAYLAQWEKRPALQVLRDLLLPPADVLRFAESGPAADAGNVPLDHGLALVSGARLAILAAACSVLHPLTVHPGTLLGEAEPFLARCRLGQTEPGGFVVTVACPVGAAPAPEDGEPFGRRATALLMRSLHRLARALELGDERSALRPAEGEPVLSANLCDALLNMRPEGDGSSLTVSASWDRGRPLPADAALPGAVRLRRESFDRIEALASRLRPVPPARRQTFVGYVETLAGRPNLNGQREGLAVLRLLLPEGGPVRAGAALNAADHHTAWVAYDRGLPIALEGVLRRAGREAQIDASGLRLLGDEAVTP